MATNVVRYLTDIGASGARFREAVSKVAKLKKKGLLVQVQTELRLLLKELRETTPKWTGAAAGTTSGARVEMYKNHPAFGMTIGNEVGDSGWQIIPSRKKEGYALTNPLWDVYLKYVEYGIAFQHKNNNSHFVQRAWANHVARRNYK